MEYGDWPRYDYSRFGAESAVFTSSSGPPDGRRDDYPQTSANTSERIRADGRPEWVS